MLNTTASCHILHKWPQHSTATLNKQLHDTPSSGLKDWGKTHENYNSKKAAMFMKQRKWAKYRL
jgi:hypothetical protein